jgi:hypothetical protein
MERLYGKASRIWVFDRGVACEKNLAALRAEGGLYLVGTPRTLSRKMEKNLLDRAFHHQVRRHHLAPDREREDADDQGPVDDERQGRVSCDRPRVPHFFTGGLTRTAGPTRWSRLCRSLG